MEIIDAQGQFNKHWFIDKLMLVAATGDNHAFVIDFEELCDVCGYRIDDFKLLLLTSSLKENSDYISRIVQVQHTIGSDEKITINREQIRLTIFGAKFLALLSNSKNGYKFWQFFIQAESGQI